MEYGEKFKKSLVGGFDRQDVLNCLQELNTRHERELAAIQKELTGYRINNEQLKREQEEQTALLTECNAALASVQGRLTTEQEQSQRLSAQLEKNREQLEQQTALAETLQKELTTQRAANSELLMMKNVLTENVKQLTDQVDTLQRKQESRASFEIGDMLIEAKITADGMIARASQHAEKVAELMESQAEGATLRIAGLQRKLSEAVEGFKRITSGFLHSVEEIDKDLDNCKSDLQDAVIHPPAAPTVPKAPTAPTNFQEPAVAPPMEPALFITPDEPIPATEFLDSDLFMKADNSLNLMGEDDDSDYEDPNEPIDLVNPDDSLEFINPDHSIEFIKPANSLKFLDSEDKLEFIKPGEFLDPDSSIEFISNTDDYSDDIPVVADTEL